MYFLPFACRPEGPEPEPVEVSEVSSALHDAVGTMVRVSWRQSGAAPSWLAFDFGEGEQRSPPTDRGEGTHEEWILGVPPATEVAFRVVTADGESDEQVVTTGPLPEALGPAPVAPVWDESAASPEGFVYGSTDVDAGPSYSGPFWLWIVDRQGRVVWWKDLSGGWQPMFPRVARDGTHVVWDQHNLLDAAGEFSTIQRATLDGAWTEEIPAPGLGWCWDETDDGAVLYDRVHGVEHATIEEIAPDGAVRTVWDCTTWQTPLDPDPEHCYTNTVNWVAATDSILYSTYWGDWIAEVDRATGEVLWYAGSLPGGYAVPADATLELQHYPNYTPDGTLLVSTHIPDVDGEQRAREFVVDHGAQALEEVWVYGEGAGTWAQYSGDAVRLPNGNTVQNYGTGGEVREVTPDGTVVWQLQWGDERTLGHTTLLNDLYPLVRGRQDAP